MVKYRSGMYRGNGTDVIGIRSVNTNAKLAIEDRLEESR
jgi:hypothetical protein